MSQQFARFLAVGAAAAVVNFGSRIVLSIWLDFLPAVALAFLFGLTTAFLLNRRLVFADSGKHWGNEALWFCIINAGSLCLTVAVSWLLAGHLLPALGQTVFVEETAHAAGIISPVAASYFGHKHFTFRRRD